MPGTEMISKYVWSLYTGKHSTSKVSPRKCSFLNEMSRVQTITKFKSGFVHMKIQQKKAEQSVANKKDG